MYLDLGSFDSSHYEGESEAVGLNPLSPYAECRLPRGAGFGNIAESRLSQINNNTTVCTT